MRRSLKVTLAAAAISLTAISGAYAATQTLQANVTFVTPISFTSPVNVDFGYITTGATGRTFTIDTAGTVGGASVSDYLNGASAGSVNIVGSATQTIDITAGNYVPDGGVTPSAATCAYDGGGAAACALTAQAAPGAGKALLVGLQIDTTGTSNDGDTAAPTFDIVVTYN